MTTLKQSNMLFHQCLLIEMWNMWSWFHEKVPSVWWLTAVCGWLWHLSTSCCWPPASGRPTASNTVTHFYAFPAYIIRKFSPLNCSSACLPLLVILFGLWHHLPYCGARWSFRTHVHDMCTQVCLCPVSFYSDWVCSTVYVFILVFVII